MVGYGQVTSEPGNPMEAETAQDSQALLAQHAAAREKLEGLVHDLRVIDDELAALAPERRQHHALKDVCGGLERLDELGGAALFWGDRSPADEAPRYLRDARSRVELFERRVGDVERRRQQLFEEIRRQEQHTYVLEDDVFEAQEEEELRRLEWIVEREIGSAASRSLMMPWARGGEDDRRFRKTLASALLVSLLFALILPWIDLPLPPPVAEIVDLPERAVRMIIKEPPLPARPVEPVTPPEQRLTERKPIEKPLPQESKVEEIETPAQQPEQPVQKGILAFRERLAGLKETQVVARLGADARINDAEVDSAARTERSMLTSNAPGSSGGINLAALSRNSGQGGGSGDAIKGVAVTKATSSIKPAGGTAARPLSGGPGLARTDEEIQIVFDRYKASLYRLYNRELRKDPSLRGQMVLRLTIEPDGRVSMCALQASDMNAPELSTQVVDRVRTINFGAKDVAAITILYPIDFLPAA
jgi:hypothetical protein